MASEAEQTSTAVLPRSEDVVKNEWDRCVANGLVKTGAGICVGVVLSALLFKNAVSPVAFTTGISIGMSYAQCQTDFANAARRFKTA